MSTMISIDWDFFIPHGMYEEKVFLPAANDHFHGMFVYDWQMSETRPPALEDALWRTRAINFKKWGLDIEKLLTPPLSIEDFAIELSIKTDGNVVPAWRGDSHAWGTIIARDYAKHHGPLRVVNFDAHHDLGYGSNSLAGYRENQRIGCDNWALIGLLEGWIKDYTVVYPDWLGKREWGKNERRPWLKDFRRKIHIQTWSEWVMTSTMLDSPEVAFLCRSSSWTPPWLDKGFSELGEELFGYVDCLDCQIEQSGSAFDTCELREWDWQEVEDEMKMREILFEELRKREKQCQ